MFVYQLASLELPKSLEVMQCCLDIELQWPTFHSQYPLVINDQTTMVGELHEKVKKL